MKYMMSFIGPLLTVYNLSFNIETVAFSITAGKRISLHKSTIRMMSKSTVETNKENQLDLVPKVAIVGGGIAGLSCGAHIAESKSIIPVVFDTGRLRPGGRCSSRYPNDRSADKRKSRATLMSAFLIDHAAQILAVPDEHIPFLKQVKKWELEGIVTKYPPGSVVEVLPVSHKKSFQIKEVNNKNGMYYGTNGMGSIPKAIANSASFKVEQDVWVSPSNGVKYSSITNPAKWKLKAKGKEKGEFDFLIIAHNGKCADRLMSQTPAKALHSLLRTNFAPTCPSDGGKRMTLNSIYSLSFIVRKGSSPFTNVIQSNVLAAFVKNHPNLSFLSCNTKKFPTIGKTQEFEVWTLLSSATFAKQYKGPQENLPDDLKQTVITLLFQSLEECLDLTPNSLNSKKVVLETALQLWGAGVPLNSWKSKESHDQQGFVYDGEFGVGVCGDWLLDSSIYGAWESGRRMATYLIENYDASKSSLISVGLPPNGSFQASNSVRNASIGSL